MKKTINPTNTQNTNILYLENLKEKILNDMNTEEDIFDAEIVDSSEKLPPTKKAVSPTSETVSKDDLVDNLLELNKSTFDILEHLKDIVMSELPDSKKITETSGIISSIVQINKTLYDIRFKDSDEVEKEGKKELNSKMIKDIISTIKNNPINRTK